MASAATLGAVSQIADHVIASELPERGSKRGNSEGQTLNAQLTGLLDNPSMTPEELSKSFVERANQGSTPAVVEGDLDDTLKHFGSANTRLIGRNSSHRKFIRLFLRTCNNLADSRHGSVCAHWPFCAH